MKMERAQFNNFKNVITDKRKSEETPVEIDTATVDALASHEEAEKHLSLVNKELSDRAKTVITDNPGTGKKVTNKFTKTLKLDESVEDFNLNTFRP